MLKNNNNLLTIIEERKLFSGYENKKIKYHESWFEKINLFGLLEQHTGCVNGIRWNSSGNLLASGSDDLKVCIWDFSSSFMGKLSATLSTKHLGNIFDTVFRPNYDNIIVSCGCDGRVGLVDCNSPNSAKLIFDGQGVVSKIDFQPNDTNVFLASFSDGLILYDLRQNIIQNGTNTLSVSCSNQSITGLEFAPNNPSIFALGADDPILRICDLRTLGKKRSQDLSVVERFIIPNLIHQDRSNKELTLKSVTRRDIGISGVAWSKDGTKVLTNYRGDDVYLISVYGSHFSSEFSRPVQILDGDGDPVEVFADRVVQTYKGRVNSETCLKEVRFMWDDKFIGTGSDGGEMIFWETKTGKIERRIQADRCVVNCVQPNPFNHIIVSSGIDSDIKVWGIGEKWKNKNDQCANQSNDIGDSLVWHRRMKSARSITSPSKAADKLHRAQDLKDQGNEYVKSKSWTAANRAYDSALSEIHFIPPQPHFLEIQEKLEIACRTNNAHCLLQLENYEQVVEECTKVLLKSSNNIKALFRRATAYSKLKSYDEALVDINVGLQFEPTNSVLLNLQRDVQQKINQEKERQKKAFQSLFS